MGHNRSDYGGGKEYLDKKTRRVLIIITMKWKKNIINT